MVSSLKGKIIFIAVTLHIVILTVAILHRNAPSSDSSGTFSFKSPSSWTYPLPYKLNNIAAELQKKLARANHLWEQSVKDRKEMVTAYDNNQTPFPDGYIYPYNVWDYARPTFFCPHDLERVGTLGDGGKWVCGMSKYESVSPGPSSLDNPARPLIVYSFGVNDDSSFEAAVLRRTNAEIWGYDYSVDGWAHHIPTDQRSRAHFMKAGIGKVTHAEATPPFYSVQDLMKKNGHTYIDIVKMDIEGAEWDAMTSLIEFIESSVVHNTDDGNAILPIGQLLVELHFMGVPPPLTVPENLKQWMEWWSALERVGLRPVNNEDNWIGDAGAGRPRFMEYTLINALDKERNVLLS